MSDTVEWISNVHTPHTVSFGSIGDVRKLIPSSGILNLPESIPAGGKYDGTGIATSAVLGLGFGPTTFELTFTKAGDYDYYCLLHANQQMVAKLTVGSQAAPGAPNTGTSAQAQPNGTTGIWLIFGAIAMVAAASAGAFAVTRR